MSKNAFMKLLYFLGGVDCLLPVAAHELPSCEPMPSPVQSLECCQVSNGFRLGTALAEAALDFGQSEIARICGCPLDVSNVDHVLG